jgi:hypothetical protein
VFAGFGDLPVNFIELAGSHVTKLALRQIHVLWHDRDLISALPP